MTHGAYTRTRIVAKRGFTAVLLLRDPKTVSRRVRFDARIRRISPIRARSGKGRECEIENKRALYAHVDDSTRVQVRDRVCVVRIEPALSL